MQTEVIHSKIYELRGHKVMLNYDLSILYGTETKRLKEAVRRNIDRFPLDFMFELTREEYLSLRTQIASLEKGRGKYSKFNPFAFTEQGVAMLESVLNSPTAIQVNISIVRVFVMIRKYALSNMDLTEKLKALESKYEQRFEDIYEALNYLLNKDKLEDPLPRTKIGYVK